MFVRDGGRGRNDPHGVGVDRLAEVHRVPSSTPRRPPPWDQTPLVRSMTGVRRSSPSSRVPQAISPASYASAWSATASRSSASCRAASRVSSTATRSPLGRDPSTKSTLTACSTWAWNGWSYDSQTRSNLNHPCVLLPLPAMAAAWPMVVHMTLQSAGRSSAELPGQKVPDLGPAVDRLLGPVGRRLVVVEEPVAGTGIAVE